MSAHTTTERMRSWTGDTFDRIYLWCPSGHMVCSTPATTDLGKRLAADDYAGEECGVGRCSWNGGAR